jgi:hypothetical protein
LLPTNPAPSHSYFCLKVLPFQKIYSYQPTTFDLDRFLTPKKYCIFPRWLKHTIGSAHWWTSGVMCSQKKVMSISHLVWNRMCMTCIIIKGNLWAKMSCAQKARVWKSRPCFFMLKCSDPERNGPPLSRKKIYQMWSTTMPFVKVCDF